MASKIILKFTLNFALKKKVTVKHVTFDPGLLIKSSIYAHLPCGEGIPQR